MSIRAHYLPSDNIGFTAIATYAKSVIKYSYDGDWGNPVLWAPDAAVYQYSEIQNRDRTTKTLELRFGPKLHSHIRKNHDALEREHIECLNAI